MATSIAISNLTKVFKVKTLDKKGVTALDDVTFSIDEGIIFGLLGPNGAGKTTLIKILLGIVFPPSGTAEILGKNISDYKIRREICYLPDNHKFPWQPARGNGPTGKKISGRFRPPSAEADGSIL